MASTAWPVHSPFAREHYGRGEDDGRAEGRSRGESKAGWRAAWKAGSKAVRKQKPMPS